MEKEQGAQPDKDQSTDSNALLLHGHSEWVLPKYDGEANKTAALDP